MEFGILLDHSARLDLSVQKPQVLDPRTQIHGRQQRRTEVGVESLDVGKHIAARQFRLYPLVEERDTAYILLK